MANSIQGTLPLYLNNSMLLKCTAIVAEVRTGIFKNKEVKIVNLNQTIFHPQGGGQKADQGTIGGVKVDFVSKRILEGKVGDFEIDHIFYDKNIEIKTGQSVDLEVDRELRALNMRLHSAGHALAAYTLDLFPNLDAIAGHHFPGEARMTFKGKIPVEKEQFKNTIENAVNEGIRQNVETEIIYENEERKLKIGNFSPVGCGGTHVQNLSELGEVRVRNIKLKKQEIYVGYEVLKF